MSTYALSVRHNLHLLHPLKGMEAPILHACSSKATVSHQQHSRSIQSKQTIVFSSMGD